MIRQGSVTVAALLIAAAAAGAQDRYLAGPFNGWSANATPMTETFAGSGVWTHMLSGYASGQFEEFKVTTGNWDGSERPLSGNSWFIADGSGNNTISFDANTVSDGWLPAANRIGVSNAPTSWTAVGDWQSEAGGSDWTNNDAATAMTDLGGGIFFFEADLAAGSYQGKAVWTGSWNAIGGDGRSVNADNVAFSTDAINFRMQMWVDALGGRIQIRVIPAPGSLALLGLGGLVGLRRRR